MNKITIRHITHIFCAISLLVSMLIIPSSVIAKADKKLTNEQAMFIHAEHLIKRGKLKEFRTTAKKLTTYPLYPYLMFQEFEYLIDSLTVREFNKFIKKYDGTPLAARARDLWLTNKAKKGQWQDFLKSYDLRESDSIAMQCNYLMAKSQKTPIKELHAPILTMWLDGNSRPKECDGLLARWKNEGYLTRHMVWDRIKLTIKAENHTLTKYLAKHLSKNDQQMVKIWQKVHKHPKLIARPKFLKIKHPLKSEIILYGISKIAANDPKDAALTWFKISKEYKLENQYLGAIIKEIALSLAQKSHVDAPKWLKNIPKFFIDDTVREWRIRAAIKNENWADCAYWINELSVEERDKSIWKYWLGRSLINIGQAKEGKLILSKLSLERSYYGFLASTRIVRPFNFGARRFDIYKSDILDIVKMPAIIRAKELFKLGRMNHGRSEWIMAVDRMSEREKQAAAILAKKWKVEELAILSLRNAIHKDDLELRFPLLHSFNIKQESRINSLDPAWVFALTRQESAFMPTAKSPSGALGLMQIMPSTAKMVAKSIRTKYHKTADLLKSDVNIKLGSKYLSQLFEQYNYNPVLATAAYNAGPNRVKKWLPDNSVSADIWIESIPYKETRNYVKNVLAYTLIYQRLLGKVPELGSKMPVVKPLS